ncbi:putative SEC14-like protein 6 [Folsomia candida]|uniref:putative SEC14-like protein 6 n=1 Tax=Folsomia candida TaxID=158441 RepID=UPI000B8FCC01|nr:putative SEC14-like protein 6 [Folsomia candida]XP_021950034.1 putative SEC14-like protein 6 [Folsomia candida]
MVMPKSNDCDECELRLLREFQSRVADLEQDEDTCLRFLTAREFKIHLAEEMMRNSVEWRKTIGIDNYLNWVVSEAKEEDHIFKITGVNHNGGPVLWVPLGTWLARYWVERGKQEETTLYGYRILETAFREMKSRNNKKIVAILGIETLTYYKVSHVPTLKVLYAAFQSLEQNYPEILQSLIIVNAPWMFSIAFSFIKPILSPKTLGKIQVFNSEREKWLPALRQLMPDSAIPSDYLKSA